MHSKTDITAILKNLRGGDRAAESRLISLVYSELQSIARRLMNRERPEHTLQPTALVHEAYLRLVADCKTDWQDRAHFFAAAAQVMRHILVDHARQHLTSKRGFGVNSIQIEESLIIDPRRMEEFLMLEDALQKLEIEDPRALQVVVFRFFAGLSIDEIAEVTHISARTVKRDWKYGKAWLKAELKSGTGNARRSSTSG